MSTLRFLWQHPLFIASIYLVIINFVLFFAMAVDKSRAKRHKRRISEGTLFLLCVLGGGIGGIAGMRCFRHKTKHRAFTWGFPAIAAAEAALAIFLALTLRG